MCCVSWSSALCEILFVFFFLPADIVTWILFYYFDRLTLGLNIGFIILTVFLILFLVLLNYDVILCPYSNDNYKNGRCGFMDSVVVINGCCECECERDYGIKYKDMNVDVL